MRLRIILLSLTAMAVCVLAALNLELLSTPVQWSIGIGVINISPGILFAGFVVWLGVVFVVSNISSSNHVVDTVHGNKAAQHCVDKTGTAHDEVPEFFKILENQQSQLQTFLSARIDTLEAHIYKIASDSEKSAAIRLERVEGHIIGQINDMVHLDWPVIHD